jgi:hypothetical protein
MAPARRRAGVGIRLDAATSAHLVQLPDPRVRPSCSQVHSRRLKMARNPVESAMSKRELISPNGDKRLVRRDSKGRFSESDDLGRSLGSDQRTQAKNKSKPGQGDRGDR